MSDSPVNRRHHPRISHPFDAYRVGLLDTPLSLYDLSLGGCFINDFHEPPPSGKTFKLRIDLPHETPVTMLVQVVHVKPGFGYAVSFNELSEEAYRCVERTLQRLQQELLEV